MKNIAKTPLLCYLGLLSLAASPQIQAAWDEQGTDIKEVEQLTFTTRQDSLLTNYVSPPYGPAPSVEIALKSPATPKSTTEWQMLGLSYYVIGGVKTSTGSAKVPYPEQPDNKSVSGSAHFTAKPTPENQYTNANASPVSTTDANLKLVTKKSGT